MSKRLRILFTIPNFNTAGSGKVVYDLVKGLDRKKFDVEIACNSNDGEFFSVVKALGLPIHIFRTTTEYRPHYNLLSRIWKISKFYRNQQYDIIHSWQWSNDWTEALAARIAGVKWMYTKKAMGFNNKHWRIKSYLANFIITINEEMRNYFPNKEQQALIPLGIDTTYYNSDLFPVEKINDIFNIITVANLVPVKGVQILIEAIYSLNKSNIKLTILGDCDNDYGRAMVALSERLKMKEQIIFLGKQLDVRPYIAKSDLYVIPTLDEGRKEGMPMALVEAMSMGLPVLGSDITGINFVLRDFKDLLFKAGDSDDLALKLQRFIAMDETECQDIGNNLRKYCESHFTMSQFIMAHEVLYKTMIHGK